MQNSTTCRCGQRTAYNLVLRTYRHREFRPTALVQHIDDRCFWLFSPNMKSQFLIAEVLLS